MIRYRGKCVPVEVKARDGNAKSLKTELKHPEKYRVDSAIKLADLNIGRTGAILTLVPNSRYPRVVGRHAGKQLFYHAQRSAREVTRRTSRRGREVPERA